MFFFSILVVFIIKGVPYNAIGAVIEDIIKPKGFSSVKKFCGHGYDTRTHYISLSAVVFLYSVHSGLY